ncbi:MAG TPA: TonB-dependent receptor [Tepidisphaeraceae bacterium]|nr:TonB-dependent receptor [Tepidisphaeraceae bacterium]
MTFLANDAHAGDATQPAVAPTNATMPSTQPSTGNGEPIPAESGAEKLDTITVTANRYPTPVADVGSSATLITADEIQQKQQPYVADVLRGTPGLDVMRSGGPSQITSVFMRGANSDHTLVLIDGIEANDPSSPSRAFDFSTLAVDDIQQIEVVRGPQSTLWGSNAIGGVINIVTKRGEGPLTGYLSSEAGSFNTFRESAGFSGGTKFVNYSLSVTENDSQGFPSADAKFGNKTPDGFDNTSFASRVGFVLSPNFDVDVITRYQDNRVRLDDGGGPGQDDPSRWLKAQQEFLRVVPHVVLFDGALVQTYGFNYTHYLRDDTYHVTPAQNVGSTLKFDFQNDLHLNKDNTLTAGLDVAEEGYRGAGVPQKYDNTFGIFVQDQASFANQLFITAGVRYEDNSLSGPNFTYRATGAYLFPTNTKLHATYGTGFKSPTLSDLYSEFGSRDLKAEKSEGWDAGVEQSFFDRRVVLDATYFSNHFRDLIDYDFITNHEDNIGVARAQGVELGAAFKPTDTLTMGLNYTYTSTRDETTGLSLLRRAPTKIGALLNYKYCPAGDVTLSADYVSSRADIDPVTFAQTRVGGYVLVNLATSYNITHSLQITARIDNLLNEHYEEVDGFGTADISFYGGLKWTF